MSVLSLTRLVRSRADGPLPGDKCPCEECDGKIGVYDSRRRAGFIFRYLRCLKCRFYPHNNKLIDADDNTKD